MDARGRGSIANARPRGVLRTLGTSARAPVHAALLPATLKESPERASTSARCCCMAGIRVDPEDAVELWRPDTDTSRCSVRSHQAAGSQQPAHAQLRADFCVKTGSSFSLKTPEIHAKKARQTLDKDTTGTSVQSGRKESHQPYTSRCALSYLFLTHVFLLLSPALDAASRIGKREVRIVTSGAQICCRSEFRYCNLADR